MRPLNVTTMRMVWKERVTRVGNMGLLLPLALSVACLFSPLERAAAQAPAAPSGKVADTDPSVMIVLDGSGSMWGKLGKDVKINAARDVLKQALPKVPTMSLGLTSFGHRRTGDCSDVEVAVAPGKGTQERLLSFLEKLNPKGKGPVGNAVKAAADALTEKTPKEARRSLIVMADNADNCKVDTCELAQEIRQSHPGLAIHVVALGVSKEELPPLACLATTTGGRVFNADQASDVASAVEQALKIAAGPAIVAPAGGGAPAAAATVPVAVAPAPKPAPAGPPGLQLSAVLAQGGAEAASGIRWRVTADPAAGKSTERRILYEGEDRNPNLDLAPGTYRVEATFGLASVEQAVTVSGVGRTQVQVPLNAGTINVKDSGARNGPSTDRIFYTLYAASSPQDKPRAIALSSDLAPVYNVPAGNYIIAVQQGLARIERSVAISPGMITDVDIPLYLGELSLAATATEGGTPLDKVIFQVFEDDPDATGGLRELIRSSASQPMFSLPAGAYLVVVRHEGAEVRERVSVKPGARQSKTLILASGRLALSARLPQRAPGRLDTEQLSYRIERLGASRLAKTDPSAGPQTVGDEISRVHAPEHALALTAGKYRVESRYGPINVRAEREIEIKAGAAQNVVMEMDAGQVTLKASGAPMSPGTPAAVSGAPKAGKDAITVTVASGAPSDVFWELLDGGGRVIWSTSQSMPRLPLAAGRYIARAVTRKAKGEQAFQVSGGDEKTVEIELK